MEQKNKSSFLRFFSIKFPDCYLFVSRAIVFREGQLFSSNPIRRQGNFGRLIIKSMGLTRGQGQETRGYKNKTTIARILFVIWKWSSAKAKKHHDYWNMQISRFGMSYGDLILFDITVVEGNGILKRLLYRGSSTKRNIYIVKDYYYLLIGCAGYFTDPV